MKTLYSILIMMLLGYALEAQDTDWDFDFELGEVDFAYAIDSKGAYAYLLQSNDTIICFDMVERAVISKAYVKGAGQGEIGFLEGVPYYYIGGLSSKVNGVKGRFAIVNLYDGQIAIDSDWFKVAELTDISYDLKLGVAFVKHTVRRDLTNKEAEGARNGKIKRGVKEIKFTFFRLNEYEQRTIIPFEQGKQNFFSTGAEMPQWPIFSKDYLLVGIADHIYSIDYKGGSVKWSKKKPTLLVYYNLKPFDNAFLSWEQYEPKGPRFLHYYSMESGEALWEQPYALGEYFKTQFGTDTIYVANMLQFDYLNLKTGKNFFKDSLQLDDYVADIKRNGEGILLNLRAPEEGFISFNILKNNSLLLGDAPKLKGAELKFLDRVDGGYVYFTDMETGVFDTKGEVLHRKTLPLAENFLWQQDSINNRLLFYLADNLVKAFNYHKGDFDFVVKVKFKGEDEFASRFWRVKDGYVISAKRNLQMLDFNGNSRYKTYFKQPGLSTGLKKALMNVGTFALGSVMKDEVYDLYSDMNNAGMIGAVDNWNDVESVLLLGEGGGAGSITNKYANRLLNVKNRIKEAKSLSNYWIVEDKLEKKLFGLRVIDVFTGMEYKSIPVQREKNISYQVSAPFGGILRFANGKLIFESIID